MISGDGKIEPFWWLFCPVGMFILWEVHQRAYRTESRKVNHLALVQADPESQSSIGIIVELSGVSV
jgi:hypothetical protein